MIKVDAYKSEDGTIFETEQECIDHESDLRLKQAINTFVSVNCTSEMHVWDIEELLYDERKELIEILSGESND